MRILSLLFIFLGAVFYVHAAPSCPGDSVKKITYEEYISLYSHIAVKHMKEYRIPASITLAQGLLESGAGNSELATKANNHFGIKCHKDWSGETYLKDDDAVNDCFRKYKSAEESFTDHALFLTTRSRYASLFELSATDYKGWAHGLKAAGYATNPAYAERLITLIERYELTQYDTGIKPTEKSTSKAERKRAKTKLNLSGNHTPSTQDPPHEIQISKHNGVKLVIVKPGESLKSIADSLQIRPWMLRNYNDMSANQEVRPGDTIYLQSKKRKGSAETHIVKEGETLQSISQQYGIRLRSLIKINDLNEDSPVSPGITLRLK